MNAAPNSKKRRGMMFEKFFHSEVSGGVVLLACTIIALVWANSPWADGYFGLVNTYVGISWGELSFKMSLGHWVGDGLMAIFFFVVGLEIKRELLVGELSTAERAILPVSAALGGAVVPALIYAIFNFGSGGSSGWAIPMATDIAFALGILSLFGRRAPLGLKVFLTALAIADDLLAVVVIAAFYTTELSMSALLIAGVFLLLILLVGRLRIRATWIYLLLAFGAWAGVLASGVHATIAGVLVAMLVPVKGRLEPSVFLGRVKRRLVELEAGQLTKTSPAIDKAQMEALDDIYLAAEDMRPAGISLEHLLHPVQAFLILPLFALFKAGVVIDAESVSGVLSPIGLGIILGLFFGKQIGITLMSWLAIRSGRADMPEGVTWRQLWGVSCLGGVGFTMSIFIGELAFVDGALIAQAKIAILAASLLAGVWGFVVLRSALPSEQNGEATS